MSTARLTARGVYPHQRLRHLLASVRRFRPLEFGPYHFPEKLMPFTIIKCLSGEPIPAYGKGANVRDWLFVEDHARALTAVFETGAPRETYNVGGSSERTNLSVVESICDT